MPNLNSYGFIGYEDIAGERVVDGNIRIINDAIAASLAEDAAALAAMMQPGQPGSGQSPARVATTTPTPQPQGRSGLTDEERRQRAARTF